ncbi:hypothetical protein EW146_g4394 [Bondarzewia mesenterica]|uniref:O-methylsterigmatocystin oxidoreductase n=1 Tax=Bondarzewia mesenterica TaxID=1095465 RepID=A0A4S4LVT4_9AGAM|nr:hypothetical protein EW146_g4394 [Bondarzewia mesenterica]
MRRPGRRQTTEVAVDTTVAHFVYVDVASWTSVQNMFSQAESLLTVGDKTGRLDFVFSSFFTQLWGYMSIFFLVMMLFPSVQRRAQEELDNVLGAKRFGGPGRLLDISDCGTSKCVEAVIKEVHRWVPAGPLMNATVSSDPFIDSSADIFAALPHRVTQDDEYNGYFIPSGRWAMLHDPDVYPDPMAFNPDRFLFTSSPSPHAMQQSSHTLNPDPEPMVFGFGRRACPGIHMASTSIFLSVASTLATFNIAKARDSAGKEIEPKFDFDTGIVAHPKKYECSISPRSEAAVRLIEAVQM